MTMRYTHIGLQDQAKAIENLPTDPKWLETGLPTEPMSQHICSTSQQICSKSGVSAGHSQSTEDTGCHSETAGSGDTNPCDVSPSVTRRQKKAPPVTDGAQVEAAGIAPASEDLFSKLLHACLVTVRLTSDGQEPAKTRWRLSSLIFIERLRHTFN